MDKFTYFCSIFVPSVIIWQFFFTFLYSESKYQKYKFRCALDNIYSHNMSNTPSGKPPVEFKVCYRNKEFAVGVLKSDIEVHNMPRYATYQIFINGEEVACYHRLKNIAGAYYYEAMNRRHENEVTSIIYAANKKIKKLTKATRGVADGYTEYSYFK